MVSFFWVGSCKPFGLLRRRTLWIVSFNVVWRTSANCTVDEVRKRNKWRDKKVGATRMCAVVGRSVSRPINYLWSLPASTSHTVASPTLEGCSSRPGPRRRGSASRCKACVSPALRKRRFHELDDLRHHLMPPDMSFKRYVDPRMSSCRSCSPGSKPSAK